MVDIDLLVQVLRRHDHTVESYFHVPENAGELPAEELTRLIDTLEAEMRLASVELRFEYAARLRDEVRSLRRELKEVG